MKNASCFSAYVTAFILTFIACNFTSQANESPNMKTEPDGELFLGGFPSPKTNVVKAAVSGLEKYRDTRPYKNEWVVNVDEQKGIIETNWFPEHKGEVKLKVKIAIWGDSFRVDVWQKVGLLFVSVEKTGWSRRTERHIQDSIAAELTAQGKK